MAQRKNERAAQRKQQSLFPLVALFTGAAVLLIAGLFLLLSNNGNASGSKTGPRLTVDRDRIDFGRVPLGKTVKAEFKVTNTGDSALTLDTSAPVQVVEGC
jgi:hypothetical protein